MKAIRVSRSGGPEVLELADIPEPKAQLGELVIEVEAIGVNFIEVYQRQGLYPLALPFTPGAEAAGVVREVGAGVTDFQVGDRVVSHAVSGAYAQRAVVAAERAVRIPDGVTTKQAAALWLQGLTAHYLTTSTYPLKAGDRALVHAAAGGVGLLLCQMATKRGGHVIATASTEEKRTLARQAGAEETIDYGSMDVAREVRRITGNHGVQVVYDSVGKTTFDASLDSLAPRGMLVLFGQSSGPVAPLDPQILNKNGSLFLTRPTLGHYVSTRAELLARAKDLGEWVAKGELSVRIGAEFPLAQAARAHQELEARRTTGKVVLIP